MLTSGWGARRAEFSSASVRFYCQYSTIDLIFLQILQIPEVVLSEWLAFEQI
jgi:hypothetical protein